MIITSKTPRIYFLLFPVPYSLFPAPCSLLPIPNDHNIKNSSYLFPTVPRSAVPRSAVPCSRLPTPDSRFPTSQCYHSEIFSSSIFQNAPPRAEYSIPSMELRTAVMERGLIR
ncbi:MAG: hypothetical protein F6J98_19235 [Moorea sp. SIO4G2]|uniref:hypothetical protein n=1 Tax=unclassified Moorena TaxID=2683338 RepID=UPI0013F81CE5|nr:MULTISPECIES: hypothetical protein [unclassified Moorena]NEO16939.1 hypothetical protein [Moorena sp. SIO3E8]NEO62448.1 hypothetical protein [Moorena sp. SIO4G2]NEQ04034.1 hypothetical protein [Moorena sp. SIO3F7]